MINNKKADLDKISGPISTLRKELLRVEKIYNDRLSEAHRRF